MTLINGTGGREYLQIYIYILPKQLISIYIGLEQLS